MENKAISYTGQFTLIPPAFVSALSSITSKDTEQFDSPDVSGGWNRDGTKYTIPFPIFEYTTKKLTTTLTTVWVSYISGVISEHALTLKYAVGAGATTTVQLDRPYTRDDLLTTLNAATSGISVVWSYTNVTVIDSVYYRLTATNNNPAAVTLSGSFFEKGGSGHGLYGTSSITIATTDAYLFPIGDYVQSHFYYINLDGTINSQSVGSCGSKCITTIYPEGGVIKDTEWSISPPYSLVSGSKNKWTVYLTDERGDSVTNFNYGQLPFLNIHLLQQYIEDKGPSGTVDTAPSRLTLGALATPQPNGGDILQVVRTEDGGIYPERKRKSRPDQKLYSKRSRLGQ